MKALVLVLPIFALTACEAFSDGAVRIAQDLEAGASRLGHDPGATCDVLHTPAKSNDCAGAYKVQIDKVGALIIWCMDAAGKVTASHSTSYHARFVDAPRTYIVDKPAGSTLRIKLERRSGRAIITDVD